MKLWTIQPIEFYDKLIKDGEIYTLEKYADPHFKETYKWMIKEMENRIGPRPQDNIFPIWAWYQYKDSTSRRPDLRTSGFLPQGTKGVRIEFEKPENQVLLSDFLLWHYPLNYWYIPDNEEQVLNFDKLLNKAKVKFTDIEQYPDSLKDLTEKSWDKVFDMNYNCEYTTQDFKHKKIQATFWSLKSSEITKVDFFKAR